MVVLVNSSTVIHANMIYLEFQYLFLYILIMLAMALKMLSMNNLGLGDLATSIDVFLIILEI